MDPDWHGRRHSGPASAALQAGLSSAAAWTAGVTALCAIWWVTELPVPVTSLVPFVVFPFTGVLTHTQAAEAYGHHLILLLLGGFILSAGMERSNAHRRIAVGMVRLVGTGKRLVLGVMLACAVCSMWISNTATTLMLLPVVLLAGTDDPQLKTPLLLGLAYSASIGGMGTPVGTPPNVVFMGVYQEATGGARHLVRGVDGHRTAGCRGTPAAA